MNIYVSNLSFNVEEGDLKELFTSFGEVSSVKIIKDRETGRSRGFGFVEMEDGLSGQNAITSLDQSSLQGRNISVTKARPKEESGQGNFGGGGYGKKNDYSKKW
ncbi:RNA recognition motif domain-containing protein [Aridibaculum aurantiacum]|uniref:RNA recognition motif domain-containing protein n=1 Tax=Aridibaculum aurantiacum TaxID=2810307 RepID=UPI001A95E170|nr:RNA-binding protein [Aridibaculum aurantiacum]